MVAGDWWLAVGGGWRVVAAVGGCSGLVVGGWRLAAVGGGWWLFGVGGCSGLEVGGWRLVVIGRGWWVAVGGPQGRSLRTVLSKYKKSGALKPPPPWRAQGVRDRHASTIGGARHPRASGHRLLHVRAVGDGGGEGGGIRGPTWKCSRCTGGGLARRYSSAAAPFGRRHGAEPAIGDERDRGVRGQGPV